VDAQIEPASSQFPGTAAGFNLLLRPTLYLLSLLSTI
jgi:hypothetical protein